MEKCQPVGVFTSLVTPMHRDGSIDWRGYKKLLDFQYKHSIDGVVVADSTGEYSAITPKEQSKLINIAVQRFKSDSGYVFVGTGDNNVENVTKKTNIAKRLGADAVLVDVPGVLKPNPSGLVEYYHQVADIMPVIVDDIRNHITPEELYRISEHQNILGIRSSDNLQKTVNFIDKVIFPIHQARPFYIWAPDDLTIVPIIEAGGHGVFSVASNLCPTLVQSLAKSRYASNINQTRSLANSTADFIESMYIEADPAPIKYMMWLAGLIKTPAMRPPMGPLKDENTLIIRRMLQENMKYIER